MLQGDYALGESGSKEYGLVDYFNANYKLKTALVKYSTLTNEEEKRAKLQEINELTNNVKEVSAKYDRILDYIEKTVKLIDIAGRGRIEYELKGNEAQEIIKVINNYGSALDLLDHYDHKTLTKPKEF